GNVHYSDKPHPGAQKVKIAPPQSYSAPNIGPAEGSDKASGEPAAAANRQYSVSIVSPQPEATITNSRSVTISVNVKPGLAAGDTITFQLDGKQRGPVAGTSVTFDDLDRGQHQVTATLNTAAGQTIEATPVTFYLREPTVFHGKPPQ
ncbi:MAG: Ig-like domain-containing protein, partial [Gammaproteobacteria bacterium]